MGSAGQDELIRLVRDMSVRVTAMEGKLDKLPDTYVQRREMDTLIAQLQASNTRMDRFEEWRASMIEKQYTQLLNMTTRADDGLAQVERRTDDRAIQTADTTSARHFQLTLTQVGWALAILSPIVMYLLGHATFHP